MGYFDSRHRYSWRSGQYPKQGSRIVAATNATCFLNEFLQRFSRCYFTSELHTGAMIEFFHAVELDSQPGKPNSTQTLPHVVDELYIRKLYDSVLSNHTIDHITFPPVKAVIIQGTGPDERMSLPLRNPVFNWLQLQGLTLKDCNLFELEELANNGTLANLRSFKVQGCVSKIQRERTINPFAMSVMLLQFRQLDELELNCRQMLPMILGGIFYNGGTLKKLTLSEPNSELLGLLNVHEMR
jgi:hypothetical protein